ncbi:hypothetical protein Ccrd_010426 [Cynara cardunculus var. scolymus]|uniref:Uncharacterized protein n=1 Tax=Cynara cardunculus var. scolymus TaxID=59895 RepID=A0A103YL74_CYNCS|nr:hypothetical protein Ccrd_010426 [Cynara cardunculus var. scolymus]
MGFVDLLSAASMPVLKVLIITALGSFLAMHHIDILGQTTRKQVNNLWIEQIRSTLRIGMDQVQVVYA